MVTKEQFMKYYTEQNSGKYNMITEAKKVMDKTKLTEEQYKDIIWNYSDYYNMYICNYN